MPTLQIESTNSMALSEGLLVTAAEDGCRSTLLRLFSEATISLSIFRQPICRGIQFVTVIMQCLESVADGVLWEMSARQVGNILLSKMLLRGKETPDCTVTQRSASQLNRGP